MNQDRQVLHMNQTETLRWRLIVPVGFFIMAFAACGALLLPSVQDVIIKFGELYLQRPLHRPAWHEHFTGWGKYGIFINFSLLFTFIAYKIFSRLMDFNVNPLVIKAQKFRKYLLALSAALIVYLSILHFQSVSRYQMHAFSPGGFSNSGQLTTHHIRFIEILNHYGINDYKMIYIEKKSEI